MIAGDVITYLRGCDGLMAEVDGRIYGEQSPQNAEFPHITVNELDDPPETTLAGESGKSRALVQVDGWVKDASGGVKLRRLEALLRNRLSGYRGFMGETFVDVVVLQRNGAETEVPYDNSGRYIRRVSMDLTIVHTSPVPDFT